MGALIQTKGTRRLANFFNTRFSAANLPTMRGIGNLVTDFGFRSSLLDISDAYLGQWPDGSDVLYPTTTITTGVVGANGSTTLTFTNALPTSPQVAVGMAIDDDWPITPPSRAIPNGTVVSNIDTTRKIVTISKNLTKAISASPAVPIIFSDADHPNLWKRWRHYLKNDMLSESHDTIQAAIFEVLRDDHASKGFKRVVFQAIEANSQKALAATEYDLASNGKIDLTAKYKEIVLLTTRTTAPAPIDPQI